MRKNCKQTYEPKGLMQILSKGGWQKKVKKATAALLAAAMVLTSSVVLPQNTKTAEAADITIGTDNGDGTYTLDWWNYSTFHGTEMPAGDFSISYSFHNASAGANNYQNFAIALCTDLNRGNQLAEGADWYMRADAFNNGTFTGSTVAFDYGNINWDTFKEILKDSNVSASVTRLGTTITIACVATNSANEEVHWGASATNCPTDAVKVYLGGEACKLTISSATVASRHELTINCVDAEGTVLKTEKKTLVEGLPYSFAAPSITGYLPKTSTVTGTMGTADETITVEYESVPTKKVIIHCISTNGTEISTKTEHAPINLPFEYDVPTISGYLPISNEKITGEMEEEDQEFTVTYKPYSNVLNIADNWSNLTTGYKVKKSGDFDIGFSFHNVSTHPDAPEWSNYAIAISTDVAGDWAHAWTTGGWFQVANKNSILAFNDPLNISLSGDEVNADTLKDSDVTVGVSRKGSKITITHTVVGSNGESYSWTATDENCPTDTVAITLTGENCKLYLFDVPESDPDMVAPIEKDVIATIGSGSYDLAYGQFDKYHHSSAPANDFTVTYKFHNNSAGDQNWNNYAIILQDAAGKTWYQRADWWAIGQDNNTAIFGAGVPSYSEIAFDVPTFIDTIKDSDVTVTVVRSGSTITIYNTVNGTNGKTLSWSASSSECPTDAITVMLGGEACMLKLTNEDIKNEASAPSDQPAPSAEPSTEPTVTPSTEPSTEPTDSPAPSDEPTPTVEPSAKPVVKNGDKVTSSGATYKVTSTKSKSVSYTAVKSSKSTSVTVPNTVKVTSNGKKVTYKVTTIAKNTFKGNKTLKKITVGKNITKIEANAFKNCKNLTTIVIKSDKLTSVAKNALSGTNKKLVIKVPAKKVTAYQKLFKGKGNANVVVKKA